MPYSGPGSPYSLVGKTEAAYFNKVNAEGGINGRKIKFISYDDAYSRENWSRVTRCCSYSKSWERHTIQRFKNI
jgi:Periplasmic binding protein